MFTNVSRPSAVDVLRPFAVGDTFYADTTSTLAKRTIGTTDQVYIVSGGVPTWSSAVVLTSLSVIDSGFSIIGSADATKKLMFEVDAQTANDTLTINTGAQTDSRTLTVPVLTGNRTLATIDQAQTFTAIQTISATSGLALTAATGTSLTISSTQASSSKDTGSIVTEGGIGAEKDIYSGSAVYAAQLLQAGSGAASSSVNLIADGGASGTNAGATTYIRNGGATIIGFGNYSAMLGGAYDARPFMYTLVPFNFLDGIRSISPTGGIGYATGAGGTVAQGSGSGKATTVTLNTVCGTITMDGAALNADTTVAFTFTNSAIASTDLVVMQHSSVGTLGAYNFAVTPGSGTATVSVRNVTPGNLSEAIVIRFAIIKAVTS